MNNYAKELGRLSQKWLDPDFEYRKKAIERLTASHQLTPKMANAMLDSVFTELVEKRLRSITQKDAPKSILYIFSATSPQAAVSSLALGILLCTESFVALSREDSGLLKIYTESLKKFSPKLAALTHFINKKNLKKYFSRVDKVIVFGNDETIQKVKRQIPKKTFFVGHGHGISVSLCTNSILIGNGFTKIAAQTAKDVWMMDQSGCLSPLVLFVPKKALVSAGQMINSMAEAFKNQFLGEKIAISQARIIHHERARQRHDMLRLKNKATYLRQSGEKGLWLVLYDENLDGNLFEGSGNQVLLIKGYSKIEEVERCLKLFKKNLQGLALEAAAHERKTLEARFRKLGFSYIARAGKMQYPPISWNHGKIKT